MATARRPASMERMRPFGREGSSSSRRARNSTAQSAIQARESHGESRRITLLSYEAVTRGEIEEQLIAIILREKTIPDEMLKSETPLAELGIDSLDSLTILFAIEEQFHISIPDDRARAIQTLADMTDLVQALITT